MEGIMKRKCDYDGKEYNASPYELRRGKGRFCSQSCALKSRNPLGLKFKEVPSGEPVMQSVVFKDTVDAKDKITEIIVSQPVIEPKKPDPKLIESLRALQDVAMAKTSGSGVLTNEPPFVIIDGIKTTDWKVIKRFKEMQKLGVDRLPQGDLWVDAWGKEKED